MNKVWVTGDAVVDLIPNEKDSFLKCPGGAPANVAVAIARLNGETGFFGRVGNDPLEKFMQQTLENESVEIASLVLDTDQRTSTVIVDLDDTGERSFTFMVKPSADQFMVETDIPTFSKNQWLHTCSIALANEPSRTSTMTAIKSIKNAGGFVSFDPNLRDEVWANPEEIKDTALEAVKLADVVKFSDDELFYLTDSNSLEQGIEKLKQYANTLVIITQGAKGALVVYKGKQQLVAGKAVKPIDTTGAGDAFVGGLLASLSTYEDWNEEKSIYESVKWANGCGALATTQKGAMTALPNKETLTTYINEL